MHRRSLAEKKAFVEHKQGVAEFKSGFAEFGFNSLMGAAGGGVWQSLARAHYDRVIADGGIIPNQTVLNNINFTNLSEIKALYDPDVFGYKVGDAANLVGKLYSFAGASSDITFATGAQPLLLIYSDSDGNYLYCADAVGSQFSTADAVSNRITGSIDIDIKIKLESFGDLCGKCVLHANASWGVRLLTGSLQFMYSPDGTSANWVLKSVSITNVDYLNIIKHIRITRNVTTGDVKFYYLNGSTWTQIGTTQTSTAGQAIFAGTSAIYLANHVTDTFKGNIYEFNLYNGIRESGGTLVSSFNASDLTAENNAYIVSSLGEQWYSATNYNATGANMLNFAFVNKTLLQFNGIDDFGRVELTLNNPIVSLNVKTSHYLANAAMIDGYTAGTLKLKQHSYPNTILYGLNGGADIGTIRISVNNSDIISIKKNGASSELKFDEYTSVIGDAGNTDVDGISIGGDGTSFANIVLNNLIVRDANDIKLSDIKKLKRLGKNNYTKLNYIIGDSIALASDVAFLSRWATLVSDHIGYKQYNLAVGGTTAQKRTPQDYVASPNFVDRAAAMPTNMEDGTDIKIFIEYGTNDLSSESHPDYTSAHFNEDFRTAIQTLINKRYLSTNLIIVGVGYIKTKTALQIAEYNNILEQIATDYNCVFVPIYQAMVDGGGDSIMLTDAHPNVAGHLIIATQINTIL